MTDRPDFDVTNSLPPDPDAPGWRRFRSHHWCDHIPDGDVPAGGVTYGTGWSIAWQDGPLDGGTATGAMVEDILIAVQDRLRHYQTAADGRFQCDENRVAIELLDETLAVLLMRTQDRIRRGVEGTPQP